MNKPCFTTILLFMVAVCQFIICIGLQSAVAIHGNDKDFDINVSAQGQTIFFDKPDFNFGQIFHNGMQGSL